ncbi:hypothetical protein T4A_8267 [Trichinella pseudospiralis]|uniref:Uncharacterized protein n=1 Tax=Trichinella pseudospiralis TaxID=6337 RepID=A0A0V1ETQ5_TRIPS|nr:hypothetical protein T4A_8267 [Trichinella pseudospiralis]KRZ42401.1 hypothetical protein T4C_8123 [Trichinella pseudospiralis]
MSNNCALRNLPLIDSTNPVEQFKKAHAELKHFKMSRKRLIDKPVNLDNNRRRPKEKIIGESNVDSRLEEAAVNSADKLLQTLLLAMSADDEGFSEFKLSSLFEFPMNFELPSFDKLLEARKSNFFEDFGFKY